MRQAYIIGHRNQYLRNVRKNDSGQTEKIMTVYKYDAARINRYDMARRILHFLNHDGEHWSIYRFDSLRGDIMLEGGAK